MKGIVNIHSYIPKYRMPVHEINRAWGKDGGRGEVSVANFDEDTITMAVQAALPFSFSNHIHTFILATTSSPFREESAASIVAYTLGLEENTRVFDMNQALSSGLSSLSLFSRDQLQKSHALIVTSDKRSPKIGSSLESQVGAAASAIELGTNHVIAEIVETETINDFGYETWQKSSDDELLVADEKFSRNIRIQQYSRLAKTILKRANVTTDELAHLIVADSNARIQQVIAKKLNLEEVLSSNDVIQKIGYTGVSMPYIMLHDTLNKAKPGDYILSLQSGSGFEAVLFQVTEEISRFQAEDQLDEMLTNVIMIDHYQEFLRKRNILERSDLEPFSSLSYIRRERNTNLRLLAQVCDNCNTIHFPEQNVCRECQQKLGDKQIRLNRKGTLFTFTKDFVFPGKDQYVPMAVVDLENGGRIFTQLTDVWEEELTIGMDVTLSFRKIHDGADYPNYFWKAVPHSEMGNNE